MPVKRIRPRALPGVTYKMPTACGRIYVTITKDSHDRPFEVFVRFGKAGHCGAAIMDGMTKLISYALRSGMDPAEAVKALSGIVCTQGRLTCLNAVAEALDEALGSVKGHDCIPALPFVSTTSGEVSPSPQPPGPAAP